MAKVLRRGAHGEEVERLQRLLREHGFPVGRIDGRFGPATEAALLAFQRANGLLADGIAGPLTWQALDMAEDLPPADATRRVSLEIVAEMFPYTRLDTIEAHLPLVLDALRGFGLVEKPMVLAALATIRAESEGFEPVEEAPSRFNSSPGGHPFDLYDHRTDLGNRGPRDGERYRGRGFVQLTGRANYEAAGRSLGLGMELVFAPQRANEPVLAARILAAFLAARRLALKSALFEGDLAQARRLVNGGSHGLERFAEAYRIGDRLIADPVWNGPAPALAA